MTVEKGKREPLRVDKRNLILSIPQSLLTSNIQLLKLPKSLCRESDILQEQGEFKSKDTLQSSSRKKESHRRAKRTNKLLGVSLLSSV